MIESDTQKIADISKTGYQMLKDNMVSEAIDCFTRILLIDENNNYALVGMGDATRKMGSVREAVKYYQRCLDYHPGNNYALFGLADCYRGLSQFEESLKYWNLILNDDPRNKMILTRAADAYRNLNDYDNAKTFYEKALNIEYDAYAVMGLAIISKIQEKYDEAIISFKRLIQQDNKNFRLYIELAECYIKINDKRKASETLEDFQKLGIKNSLITEMLVNL